MTGWKTKVGGIGGICTGLGMCIAAILADPIDGTMLSAGLALMAVSLEGIGIGHKLEKSK